ncbi:MAG: MBL fold metallo-hydrolase [Deltaproteobacteria bacterium]|nr:MBL fold metallo-hydrolase [Deltaproteobacteria bacterium]
MVGVVFAGNPQKLELSILCDDAAVSENFMKEHGVSILIKLPNGHRWLFDAGTTDVFMENAKIMGERLDNLEGIMISHGHDDHGGGLAFYPRLGGEPPVYGHPLIWVKQYQIKKGKQLRICHIPYLARKNAGPHFKPLHDVTKLDENMYFFTDVKQEPGSYCPTYGKFYNEDGVGPWEGTDDATVAVDTPEGVVAIFGCGHAGYINILKAIKQKFPDKKILSVVGGLHLKAADEKILEKAAKFTDSVKAKKFTFYGGHCTGKNAIEYFKAKYGEDVVRPYASGTVIKF